MARFELTRATRLLADWDIRNDLVPKLKLSAFKTGNQVLGPGPAGKICAALPPQKRDPFVLAYLADALDRMEERGNAFLAKDYAKRLRLVQSRKTGHDAEPKDLFDQLRDVCDEQPLLRDHVVSLLRLAELEAKR